MWKQIVCKWTAMTNRTEDYAHLRGHSRSIIVMVLSSTTSLVTPADCTLMDTRYLLWGTSIIILSRDFSFSSFLENSTSWVSIFRHSMLYPSKSESGGIQEQAMAVEFWGRQCRFWILSGSKGERGRDTFHNSVRHVFLGVQLAQRSKQIIPQLNLDCFSRKKIFS